MATPLLSPPLCYIAGPYRASNAWKVEANVRAAEQVGLEVARLGGMPIIPHTNCRYFHGIDGVPETFWLEGTLRLLSVSDVLILLPDWPQSSGSRAEYAYWLTLPPTQLGERHDTLFDFGLDGRERFARFVAALADAADAAVATAGTAVADVVIASLTGADAPDIVTVTIANAPDRPTTDI